MWSVCICDSEGPRCLRKSLVRDFETLHIFASAYSYSILFPIAGSTNNQLEIANFGTKKNLERPLFPLKQRLSATIFAKNSTLDVWEDSVYASEVDDCFTLVLNEVSDWQLIYIQEPVKPYFNTVKFPGQTYKFNKVLNTT